MFKEEGRGLLHVDSGVYYGFMSCFPVCLLSSEQCGLHPKQAVPSSFILGFFVPLLLHIMRNSKKKSKEVSGLVCCGEFTPLPCFAQ